MWIHQKNLRCVGILLVLGISLVQGADDRVKPSRTQVKPFAVEFLLLAKMTDTPGFKKEDMMEKAMYVKKFGGSGYAIKAYPQEKSTIDRQTRYRKSVYLSLTDAHLRAASGLLKQFVAKEKMRIKPGRTRVPRTNRAYPAYRIVAGIEDNILQTQKQIDNIKNKIRHGRSVIEVQAMQDHVRRLEGTIDKLNGLKKGINVIIPRILAYDAFLDHINHDSGKEGQAERVADLKKAAASLAASDSGITACEAVGYKQVRLTVTPEKQKRILSALVRQGGSESPKKKMTFLQGKPDFIPRPWKAVQKKSIPGDFAITEVVCGDKLVLTLFECTGLWYPLSVIEQNGRLSLFLRKSP